jgi:nuclear pore complex protein Nup205
MMDSISRVRDMLASVMSGRESHHTEQELFDELLVQKPRLLNLLDVGGRNAQEQRELESGASSFL